MVPSKENQPDQTDGFILEIKTIARSADQRKLMVRIKGQGHGKGTTKQTTMIIAIPPKTLTAKQKEQLTKKGYIVIETDQPDKIRVITPETPIEAHDYYMAALYALQRNDSVGANSYFIKELYRRLNENQSKEEPQ